MSPGKQKQGFSFTRRQPAGPQGMTSELMKTGTSGDQCILQMQGMMIIKKIVKMEGVRPLEENVGNAPRPRFERNKLLLVASVIQALGLLLCLTYVCQHFHAPEVSLQYPPIENIKTQLQILTSYECEEDSFILPLQKREGTMEVQNNSVVIQCDGFYLLSLKGYFSQEVNISLHYRKGKEPFPILKKAKFANSNVVLELGYKDKVYLNVTSDSASCKQLSVNAGELIVLLQNPGGYCAP
ncbi:tumor necrosis factor ligand superfamily member 4 isoform X1 [Lepus europaeus]|uniref:tumor necrosis factor ligand superfamily member 4 isoform X1 n=3 Tax=Lepus europaeus TaxID=9983 RepID=UPI002B470E3A|nr:tumor necrosis factor ligand superfamily member 4 isoform X1 [Lepus europaeus]